MKLRVKGNSIRLRLTQGEVDRFREKGVVREITAFDLSGTRQLIYVVESCDSCQSPEASINNNIITVKVPVETAREWTETDLVGFDNGLDPEEEDSLYILVEKDFQCLHKRPHEDESDHFPNPLAGEGS